MATQNVIKSDLALILVKAETTYGTDPTPTEAANAIQVRDFSWTIETEEVAKSRVRATYASAGVAIGQVHVSFSFSVPLVGGGDPGGGDLSPPDYEPLLLASGLAATTSGGPPVDTITYNLDSQGTGSVTLYAYVFRDDGSSDLYEINGAMVSATLSISSGSESMITFEGSGLYNDPVAAAPTLASVAYLNPFDDSVAKGMTVTVAGTTRCISEFSLESWRDVVVRPCADAAQGVTGIHLRRAPDASLTCSFNPEMRLEATYDHLDKILNETLEALVVQCDSAGGDRITINAPKLQQASFTHDDADGVFRLGQTCYLQDSTDAGDDAFNIVYTRTP